MTHPTLVTQLEGVEGADSEHLPVRTPGERRDRVVMETTAVHEATVAVPHLKRSNVVKRGQSNVVKRGQCTGDSGCPAQPCGKAGKN